MNATTEKEIKQIDRDFLRLVNVGMTFARLEGLSQYRLAQRLDLNPTLLNKYLRGKRPMPEEVKRGLITELGLERSWRLLSAPAPMASNL